MLRHRINVGRHHIQRIFPIGLFDYSQWLTENFPDADRFDHQDPSGSSVLEASYSTALALGRELVLDPGFDDPTKWALNAFGSSWSIAAGIASYSDADNSSMMTTTDLVEKSKSYQLIFDISNTIGASITWYTLGPNANNILVANDTYANGNHILNFTAPGTMAATTGELFVWAVTGGNSFDIDNISLKQTGILASSAYPGAELVINGDFSDGTNNWNDFSGSPTTKEIVSGRMHVVCNGSGVGIIQNPNIAATIGLRYVYEFDYEVISGTLSVINSSASNYSQALTGTGNIEVEYVAGATPQSPIFRQSGAINCEFFINNVTLKLTNPMNGDTVVATVGVPTNFGSLGLSVVDDGATSYSDIHSAETNSKFNPAAGFVNIWAKVRAASVWTDGITRDIAILEVDTENRVYLRQDNANNALEYFYEANNVLKRTIQTGVSTVDWFMMTITWDIDAGATGEVRTYFNGAQEGATLTNLGTWIGNLGSTTTIIGALSTTPVNVWDGARTRFMLGYEAITPAQVLSLYNQGVR